MGVVVAQVHAASRCPAEAVERREFPVGAEHHRVIPVEHMHVQRVAPLHQPVEEFPQQRRRAVGRHRVEVQLRLAVEVPGEDRDRALGAQRRLVERLEVIGRVDEEGDALGARHRPAVVAGAQDRRRAVRRLDARGGGCRAFASHAAVEIQHAAHYVTRTLPATHRAPKGAGVVAPVAAGALVVGVANGAGVCAAVPLVIGAVGPTVTPGTAVCGVSLMPRPNGLSLVLRTVVPPAAAEPACSVAAGLACVTVLVPMALLAATRPVTCTVPSAVGSCPPISVAPICCAVGVAMPRLISDWRAVSSVCAICSALIVPSGVKLTTCVTPMPTGVVRVTGSPSARPFTRLAKFTSPPAKARSCGARRCTSSTGEVPVCTCTVWACTPALAASAAAAINRRRFMATPYFRGMPGS